MSSVCELGHFAIPFFLVLVSIHVADEMLVALPETQARRALRALKGLVRLQALIRGQAVRRQTAATLRGLESLMRIQARHRSRAGGVDHHQQQAADDDDALLLRRGRELFAAAAAVHVSHSRLAARMNGRNMRNDWRRTCSACG